MRNPGIEQTAQTQLRAIDHRDAEDLGEEGHAEPPGEAGPGKEEKQRQGSHSRLMI